MNLKQINTKNIKAFFQGKLRYKIYYSIFAFLLLPHIREQIYCRIDSMDKQCYEEGQCKMCGCQTTALQMANKECDKPCYPRMLSRKDWNYLKRHNFILLDNGQLWKLKYGIFKLIKEENEKLD